MEVMCNNYVPGDSSLVEKLVSELKSQGIFDQFRKECISDVDTKPAYQNLRQRVEGTVATFLKQQTWSVDLNKNQLREQVRKNLHESGFLETGVERIVDQVVNPKINSVFLPKVEDVVYGFLGIEKPVRNIRKEERKISITDLLPTDLEAVSPESVDSFKTEKKDESLNDSLQSSSKMDEDESPPFEPLCIENNCENFTPSDDNKIVTDENSRDSHLSGFSGLQSHESPRESDIKIHQTELSNQDSLNSSETHLSIITSEETTKMEICEDSNVDTKLKNKSVLEEIHGDEEVDKQADENHFKELNQLHDTIIGNGSEKHNDNEKRDKIIDKKFDKSEEKKSKSSSDKSSSKDRKDDKYRKTSSSKDREKSSSKYSSYKDQPKDKDESKRDSKIGNPNKDKDKSKDKVEKDRPDKEKDKSSKGREKLEKERSKSEKDKKLDKSKSDKESDNKIDKEKSEKSKDRSRSEREKSKSDKVKGDRDKDKYKTDKGKDRNSKEKYRDKSDKDKSSKTKERSDRDKDKSSKEKSSREKENASKELKDKNKENEKESIKEKNKDSNHSNSSKNSSGKDRKRDSGSSHSSKEKSSSSNVTKETVKHATGDVKSKPTSEKLKKDEDKNCSTTSNSKNDKSRDSKKKSKDDHYSSKMKTTDRRSTDRDSNDGTSGKPNYLGSYSESSSSRSENNSQEYSNSSFSGGSGDSGNSEQQDKILNKKTIEEGNENKNSLTTQSNTQAVKYIKPKFALNFQEARKLMKIRKQLAKLERQNQLSLSQLEIPTEIGKMNEEDQNSVENTVDYCEKDNDEMDLSEEKENINISETYESDISKSITATVDGELSFDRTDLSREKFEALEAKLAQVMAKVDYNSYESDEDYEFHGYSSADALPKQVVELNLNIVKRTIRNHQSETENLTPKHFEMNSNITGNRVKEIGVDIKTNTAKKINNMKKLSIVLNKTTDSNYEDGCRFLEKPSPNEEKHLQYMHNLIEQLQREVKDTVANSQTNFWSLGKGKKRKLDDNADMRNNNNSNYFATDITSDEHFSLPLSPAESDKSNDRKEEDLLIPTKQKRIVRGYSQRYSSDDLYKPRPLIGRRNKFQKTLDD